MDLFKIDPGLAIWTWISFGVLFAILLKFVFPKLLKNISDRETLVAQSVDKAREIESRLAGMEGERTEVLRKAGTEAEAILRQARKDAEEAARHITDQAEEQAREILRMARLRVEEERTKAVQDLRDELVDFVCASAEKVIATSFTSDKDRSLVRNLTENL